jgi:catechol 2,3-dioxygenase-like lactoylglutathione lyase family enzyme
MQVLSSRVILHVADLGASRRFYEQVVGLHIYREWGVGVAYFLGGGFLEVSQGSPRPQESPGERSTLWLQLPTLSGVEVQLVAAGVRVRKPTEVMPWGLVELWVEDPDGNELRFIEVPSDHPLRRR